MKIHYKTNDELEIIKQNGIILSNAIAKAAFLIKEGVNTNILNDCIEKEILDSGAVPSFKGYEGYPFASCISVNDAVVHGFPNNTPLKKGDIISIDVGVFKNGFHCDSAYTFVLGDVDTNVKTLIKITKESLFEGIKKAIVGNRIGDISYAIQHYCEEPHRFGVVRTLVGHGVGKHLHEEPQVPNFGHKGKGLLLNENIVIAIEPMINQGTKNVYTDNDGWTIKTDDNKPSAHFEHTIAIKKKEAYILSTFEPIEKAIQQNPHLWKETF